MKFNKADAYSRLTRKIPGLIGRARMTENSFMLAAAGGLIVGPLVYFFAKEAKGHGVPEVMQSVLLRGAILGSFIGDFAHTLFPDITASSGAYALVAMGGLVSATTFAPITAIIMIFEMTAERQSNLCPRTTCRACLW